MIIYALSRTTAVVAFGIIFSISNISNAQIIVIYKTYAYLFLMFYILSYILVEAFLLSTFGYTLGKWLLNVKIREINGNKITYVRALKRIGFVFIYVFVIFIPFIGFPILADSYHHIAYHNTTIWDIHSNIGVSYRKNGVFRTTLADHPLGGIIVLR